MARAEFLLLLAWSGFFIIHSLLAGHTVKNAILTKLPRLEPCYRLAYNLVALLTLLPVLWIHLSYDAAPLWQWHGPAQLISITLTLLALFGFLWSLKYYDMRAFTGLQACRKRDAGFIREGLTLSPLHRVVRHPWYLFAIVIIWARDQTSLTLISSVMMTLYFFIGSKLEERKLLRDFGAAYRDYMARVPGIIPRPWRRLSAVEAQQISRRSRPPADSDRPSG